MASFMLKPEPLQDLSIRVVGFDPITEAVGPLSRFWVELTGRYTLQVDEPKPSPPIMSMEFTNHSFHVHFRGSGYALATDGGTNTISVGRPYGDAWSYGGTYNALHHGAGLVFDSGADLRIDLFARRKKVDLEGVVFLDPDDPTTWQVLANPAQGDEVVLYYADMAETGGSTASTRLAPTAATR